MKLADYLKGEGLTLEEFAARIDRTAATVSRLARGQQRPDWSTIDAIRRATDGKVQPNDFFDTADSRPCDTEDAA